MRDDADPGAPPRRDRRRHDTGSPAAGSGAVLTRLLAVSLTCAVAFLVLGAAVATDSAAVAAFDGRVSERLFGFTVDHPVVERCARLVTVLGAGWTVTLVTAAAAIGCAARREWALGWWLAIVVAGSALLNTAAKSTLDTVRPATEGTLVSAHGSSFPSGHTQAATVAYVAVVLVVGWRVGRPGRRLRYASAAVVVAVVGGVGLSRIFLGVHWPTDVLGGWLFGSAWVTAATYALLRYVLPPAQAPAGGDTG